MFLVGISADLDALLVFDEFPKLFIIYFLLRRLMNSNKTQRDYIVYCDHCIDCRLTARKFLLVHLRLQTNMASYYVGSTLVDWLLF